LDLSKPFTAARARNAGFKRLRQLVPDIPYVQFLDGDCELAEDWPEQALSFLESQKDICIATGRLRERCPDRSVYNWLCDREWEGPTGEVSLCGGIAMIRADALEAEGGYREDLIAGEEPELCARLRASGWRIWRLQADMALHDAAMTSFSQWLRRTVRNGYAMAQGAHLHGAKPERYWVWESRRAWLWGIWLPIAWIMAGLIFGPWGWATCLIFPLQVVRLSVINPGPFSHRATQALFQVLARFPEGWGQVKFVRDRILRWQTSIIEYK
jgi:GT2 family glycosyltransferase